MDGARGVDPSARHAAAVHEAVVRSMCAPPPPPPVDAREADSYWKGRFKGCQAALKRTEEENMRLQAALRAEQRAREGDLAQRVQEILERVSALPVARACDRGDGDPTLEARMAKARASQRSAERACAKLAAALRNYHRIVDQSTAAAQRAALNTQAKARQREKEEAVRRAVESKVWPPISTHVDEHNETRLSPFHLIRAPVTVLAGIQYEGYGTIADIENAAAGEMRKINGTGGERCEGFGKPAYGGQSRRGAHELHMRREVIGDKIDRAMAHVDARSGARIEDFIVHLQVHGSAKGEGWAMYRRAVQAWADMGGLLLFRVNSDSATFDALFVDPEDLRRIAGDDSQPAFADVLVEHDSATREYMCRYMAYYARLIQRGQPQHQDDPITDGEGGAIHADQWAGAMRDRAIMCTRVAGLQPAADIYTRLAQLASGDVPFPGFAPDAVRVQPLVRKVRSGGCGWWVQGVGRGAKKLRRSTGPADRTPPEPME